MSIKNTITNNSVESASFNGKNYVRRVLNGAVFYDIESTSGGGGGAGYGFEPSTVEEVISDDTTTLIGGLDDNGLGVYSYKSLTIDAGATLNTTNDYVIISCSDFITVNGTIEHIRSSGFTDSGVVTGIPTLSRRSNQSSYPALQSNPNQIACSAGGGGGGGTGDRLCDGGVRGDDCFSMIDGSVITSGGGGGGGGANSVGFNGGNAANWNQDRTQEEIDIFQNFLNELDFSSKQVSTSSNTWETYYGNASIGLLTGMSFPILLGGNGGPGGHGDSTAGKGGLGGGMVLLYAPIININTGGIIRANGNVGLRGPQAEHMGGPGGGGGGGCVILASSSLNLDGTIEVEGAAGGYNSNAGWVGSRNSGGHGGKGLVLTKTT